MKRKAVCTALSLALVLFVASVVAWFSDPVNVENWQRIRLGMTEQEVESILGRPGLTDDGYIRFVRKLRRHGVELHLEPSGPDGSETQLGQWYRWNDERIVLWQGHRGRFIGVQIAQDGRVRAAIFKVWHLENTNFFGRIYAWLTV